MPGCRETKYVQHSSKIPISVVEGEDFNWCTCQRELVSKGLSDEDRKKDVIATHEKTQTCGACCCYEPYLLTKDASGNTIGRTEYVCDWWSEYNIIGIDCIGLDEMSSCFIHLHILSIICAAKFVYPNLISMMVVGQRSTAFVLIHVLQAAASCADAVEKVASAAVFHSLYAIPIL